MIVTNEQLSAYIQEVQNGPEPLLCAVDTEADSLHRYQESLCLIQFATREGSILIDPLEIADLTPLGNYLADATVWMHGADYDMTMFKRQFGELPAIVYDTQIGARLLGVRKFGLGNLVSHYFGIELSKSSQKADWGKRPLSEKMIDYALDDVNYLLEMGDKIVAGLKECGRYDWFVESCESARQKVLEREVSTEDNWRINGSGKLSRLGLAYLKALWYWRDAEAESWDRPTFMVATNRNLIAWSDGLAEGKQPSLPKHYRPGRAKRFYTAVDAARALTEEEWPKRPKTKRSKRDPNFDEKVDAMMSTRNEVAEKLDIDSSLIAARAVIEAIAGGDETPESALMKWQRECLNL